MEKQQRFNRLQFLLQRAGIYSNWLAEKLQERQQTLLRSEETASKNQDSGSAIIDDAAKNDALLSNNSSLSTADPATVSSSSLIAHTPDLSQQITRRRSKRASATSKSAVESTSSSGNPVASAKRKQNTIGTAFSNSSGDNKKVKTNDDVGANAAFKILLAERLAGKKIERQPAFVTGCTMREYQLVGLEWLVSLVSCLMK